jgi:serine/threonine protein kinase
MGQNTVKDCVALKTAKEYIYRNIFNNEVRILKEFAQLEKEEDRRHLVKLYQHGHMDYTGHRAYIMELGEKSLEDYFYNNAADLTEGKIKEIAKEIALAMCDFHRGKK